MTTTLNEENVTETKKQKNESINTFLLISKYIIIILLSILSLFSRFDAVLYI